MNLWHVFSGGELKDAGFIKISAADTVICADSGLVHAEKSGISPDIVIGDFDSYSGILPENAEIIRSVPEKDDSDTMLAVKTAIERGAEEIRIYGALGGRFDHAFANVQTLKYAMDRGCRAVLIDSENEIMLAEAGNHRFQRREESYFSVFSYSEQLNVVRLSGVKYPLENRVLTASFPLGLSNEITGAYAELEIGYGTALIIFSKK